MRSIVNNVFGLEKRTPLLLGGEHDIDHSKDRDHDGEAPTTSEWTVNMSGKELRSGPL